MLTTELIQQFADDFQPELVELRRDFHRHPELAFQEERTAGIVQEKLTQYGVESKRVATTGVLGVLNEDHPGPTIMLRADMDALPVQEADTGKAYTSQNEGVMHACGHDAHVAILLVVAKILAAHQDQLPGTVKFAFQPAEENKGGAQPMINEGVLDDPRVDAVFGLHVGSFLPVGTVGLLPEVGMAASDSARITVHGKGGHGAMPADTIDATMVASQIVVALQTIISREIPPQDFGVITVGSLHSGTVGNVISGKAELALTIRSFDENIREFLEQRVREVAVGTGTTFRAAVDVDYRHGYPVLKNTPEMIERVRESSARVVGESSVMDIPSITGSEDFSYFLRERPGAFFWLGAGNPQRGIDKPHHHPEFDIDEAALSTGVKVLVQTTLDFLNDHS